ncbi:MAG: hypothetical protein K6F09_09860 [Clostridiales bacterium]|nr:hypothetical protein [Clostridiales bacterium]
MTALYIILGIILLIVLIFSIKITAEVIFDETFSFAVKVLFLKFTIYPKDPNKKPKKKKEKKKEQEPEEKKEEEKEEQKEEKPAGDSFVKRFYKAQGFEGTLLFIKDMLHILKGFMRSVFIKGFVIEKFFVKLSVSKSDAAETAIAYGKTCAAVYPAAGYICEVMRVKKYDFDVSADYLANKSTAKLNFTVSTRPIRLTNAVVVLGVKAAIAYFIKAKGRAKKRKKEQDAEQHASEINANSNIQKDGD